MIDFGLHRRVALVTGAAYGLGRVSAELFAAAGAWVAVNYRSDVRGAKSLLDMIRSDGGRALLAPGDIRTPEGAWAVARYVEHEWGHIDIVLHTAALLSSDELVTDPFPLLFVFRRIDPDFAMRARGWRGGFIVGGHNYGQGSSREHAALAPRELGRRGHGTDRGAGAGVQTARPHLAAGAAGPDQRWVACAYSPGRSAAQPG